MVFGVVDFFECVLDNWIGVGGVFGVDLECLVECFLLICYGFLLFFGGFILLDVVFIE